jgi:hypothetical protein
MMAKQLITLKLNLDSGISSCGRITVENNILISPDWLLFGILTKKQYST